VKGLQVAPAEVEGMLLQHPGVLDAAVVGYKMKDGEYPKAYVVKKLPDITGEELQKFVEGKLSKHKWLTAGVEFIDAVPRTASGKVIRRALPQKDATSHGKL
jgi:4-coumarate--CoA ligase